MQTWSSAPHELSPESGPAAEKPEAATKTQSRTKSVITVVYPFVLLRVFVAFFSTLLEF